MIISHTTRTALSSILSSSRTARRACRSPTRKRPRRLLRRCMSVRSMRARKPAKLPLPPPEAKDLHRSPTAKGLADPSSAVCCIVRALPRVPPRPQLLRLQYPLDHLPPWLQAHRQPREICLSTSMILRRKGFWTSSYTWALRKIKLPTIQTSSSLGLRRNRLQLASLLLLVTTTSHARLRRLLLVFQSPR